MGDDRRVASRSGDRGGRASVNLPVSTFSQTVSAANEGLLIGGGRDSACQRRLSFFQLIGATAPPRYRISART